MLSRGAAENHDSGRLASRHSRCHIASYCWEDCKPEQLQIAAFSPVSLAIVDEW
jgi:hypothetical protein